MKQEIIINGFKFWLDSNNVIYSGEKETVGIGLYSSHVSPNERKQVLDQLKYGR